MKSQQSRGRCQQPPTQYNLRGRQMKQDWIMYIKNPPLNFHDKINNITCCCFLSTAEYRELHFKIFLYGHLCDKKLTWIRTLGELGTEVEHLVEELVPGQVAEEDERRLAVGRQAAEPEGPLRLQVRENEGEVLHIIPAQKNPNCYDSMVPRCTVAVLLAG